MIGHLGARVSALLDGQLPPEEAERAWAHVHGCHQCRDLVEREGWIKTRLAGLADDRTPESLKGSLAHGSFLAKGSGLGGPTDALGSRDGALMATAVTGARHTLRTRGGTALLGGTAIGAAVAGVIALGIAPGAAPADRRPPVTSLTRPSTVPTTAGTPADVSPTQAHSQAHSQGPGRVSARLRLPTRHGVGGIAGVKIVP